MKYGIDLHSTTFVVAFKNQDGKIIIRTFHFKKNGLKIFKEMLTKDDVIAIESTINSYYFYDEISPLVKEVKIVNPGRFKVISETVSKNDKKDAKKILEFLEIGLIPEIKIPVKAIRLLRALFKSYLLLVKNKTMYKNRIHSILKANGVFISKKDVFSKEGRSETKNLDFNEIDKLQIDLFFEEMEALEKQLENILKEILSFSILYFKEVELLTSIPGIGLFIALAIIADIGEIKNFNNAKKLCSYLGLVPIVKESNGKKWTGKITKRGRKIARSFLTQAIFNWIKSSVIYKEFYDRKSKEKGKGKAIVALMRKLIVVIYHMLKKNQKYYYINKELHQRKINEVNKMIKYFRTLDKDKIDKLENDLLKKYDFEYQEEIKEKIEKNKICA